MPFQLTKLLHHFCPLEFLAVELHALSRLIVNLVHCSLHNLPVSDALSSTSTPSRIHASDP